MSDITFREPKRENAPLLIGLAGGTGSGKTYSALRLARGLADGQPFAVIDTENGRALHYAEAFPDMRHGRLDAPFSPARYIDAVKVADAAGFPVIVVDSGSHIWEGVGGVLEMQKEEHKKLGNREATKMLSWVEPKQAHRKFVNHLLQMKAHVILCLRAEDKIEMVKVDGETVVRPKQGVKGSGLDGWFPICEKRLPFELTLSFLLNADAPGVPKPIKLEEQHRPFFPVGEQVGEETGRALAEWARGGGTADDPDVAPLTAELLGLADERGIRDQVVNAIALNRRAHGASAAHAGWLRTQVEKAKAAAPAVPAGDVEEAITF